MWGEAFAAKETIFLIFPEKIINGNDEAFLEQIGGKRFHSSPLESQIKQKKCNFKLTKRFLRTLRSEV